MPLLSMEPSTQNSDMDTVRRPRISLGVTSEKRAPSMGRLPPMPKPWKVR